MSETIRFFGSAIAFGVGLSAAWVGPLEGNWALLPAGLLIATLAALWQWDR